MRTAPICSTATSLSDASTALKAAYERAFGRASHFRCSGWFWPGAGPWPLLILALPAAVAVWSGWVGIGQLTGFGQVHPLPGIWDSFHLDTAVTLPVGVEAYAAYALRAWLSASTAVSARTRRFARRSAILNSSPPNGTAPGDTTIVTGRKAR
jgi:hypothetical protein